MAKLIGLCVASLARRRTINDTVSAPVLSPIDTLQELQAIGDVNMVDKTAARQITDILQQLSGIGSVDALQIRLVVMEGHQAGKPVQHAISLRCVRIGGRGFTFLATPENEHAVERQQRHHQSRTGRTGWQNIARGQAFGNRNRSETASIAARPLTTDLRLRPSRKASVGRMTVHAKRAKRDHQ